MEAWKRVWGRLDENRTRDEVLRKLHGHSWTSHGRATHICGCVVFVESKHGQDGNPARPCDPGRVGSLKIELIGTQRFDSHGQLGEPHGRVACPCESGNLGFSANFEPQVRKSDFLSKNRALERESTKNTS
ncbi:unnamed protein product [Linum trigynum]|uniref:Uncharacterized protein n=1 Tax=Linum trigynum TaxID=586398 RepID=A0AAV2CLZ3_9ROSI